MKILTILGTRPEIIRLSRVIPLIDEAVGRKNHILVNTGQNPDPSLSTQFFSDLGIRDRNYVLTASGSFGQQIAVSFPAIEHILERERPDRVLVLGDTNSSLAAIVAARMGIPVYHMEAGNRSYSPTSPEEVNRRLIDHCSTVHLPYTERSRQNLLAEGVHSSRIFVIGNPIWEVIQYFSGRIDNSVVVFTDLGIVRTRYFLVTLHRAENVDDYGRLGSFIRSLNKIQIEYGIPVIVSTHPHLRQRIDTLGRTSPPDIFGNSQVRFVSPFGFFDFIALERSAKCVLSDSGTVQEECSLLHVPNVTLRDYTERPECLEAGASVLSGVERVAESVKLVTESKTFWAAPVEYLRNNVADTVVNVLLSHLEAR